MKTSEFIKQFNEAGRPDYSAQRKDNGDDRNLVINYVDCRGKSMTKACLIEGNTVWDIDGGLFSAKMLELMAELAKTPPEFRGGSMAKPLTYHEFSEKFNAISCEYHTFHSNLGPVKIVDSEAGGTVAQLYTDLWVFFKQPAFDPDEMTLMTRLAATPPELRRGAEQ